MRRIILSLLMLYFSLLLGRGIYARDYFRFETEKSLVPKNNYLEIQFSYLFEGYEEKDFVVRPVLAGDSVKIYNEASDGWVSQHELWTEMPALKKTMKIKPDFGGSSDLYFQIQNTTNAQIYETPKQTIWSENLHSEYLETLNKNIKMYALRQQSLKKEPKINKADLHQQKSAGLFAKVIKYISEII